MATFAEVEFRPQPRVDAVPSLKANFSWTMAGNFLYSGCQWGMISVLAKLGSAAIVGRLALGLAIAAPVFMFTNLQLRNVQATDARSEFAFADYFTLRTLASLFGLLVVCSIVAAGRYDPTTRAVVILVALAKTVETFSDVVAGLLQKAERLDRVAISLMIRGGCSLLIFAWAFWFFRSLPAALGGMVTVWISVFAFYDLRQARRMMRPGDRFFAFRWTQLKALAIVSAPLGVVMTLISLNVNVPRYILAHLMGQAELGIFASLAYLLVAISLVINALGQSVVARLSRSFANGHLADFRSVLGRLLAFAASILVVGLPAARLLGGRLLTLMYRPEYGRHVSMFVVMVGAAGVYAVSSFLGYGMTAARCFRLQVPVMAATAGSTVLFSLFLIPRYGGDGAAWAIFIGACVQVAGNAAALRWAMLPLRRLA